MRHFSFLFLALGLTLACGCGDNGPLLVDVVGIVTLDNKPLADKTLRFIPEPGTPGQGAGATTDAEGKYKLLAVRGGATRDTLGVPPGSYKVIVTEPLFPIETKIPEAKGDEPAPAIGLPNNTRPKKPSIPPAYSSAEFTRLQVTVPAQGGKIDLVLTSGK
ncbi:MAG: carboxypeptidase regulatory-like domain-containing protein [Gemmataceae bacterium]|nr:carboxypeptidase regulatory-like domain-containing protein [Gemmataceae bacterium]